MYRRRYSKWIKHYDFILSDIICMLVSLLCAFFLRHGFINMFNIQDYRNLLFVIALIHFCIVFFSDFYSGILRRGYFKEAVKVIQHNIALILILFAYMFTVHISGNISRITVISFFFINIFLMYIMRVIIKKWHQKRNTSALRKNNLLVITSRDIAEDSIYKITNGPNTQYKIVGIVLTDSNKEDIDNINGIPVVANAENVFEYCRVSVVNDVYIRLNKTKAMQVEELAYSFLNMGIEVHINIEFFAHSLPNAGFETINEAAVLTTTIRKATPGGKLAKRILDIAAGIVGCMMTAVLYIFVAPIIKIADPKGPVIFAQTRAGKNGKPFKIYKFRSMYSDAEERKAELMEKNKMNGLMFKVDADPRIIGSGKDGTRKGVGYFIRKTSIDEFPNFYSILKGDMSLVGTRPPTMDEYAQYQEHHKSRLAGKPGLTGLWQISGRSDMTDFEEIVKMDNDYIMNWSFLNDIKIVLQTVWVVLAGRGSQ